VQALPARPRGTRLQRAPCVDRVSTGHSRTIRTGLGPDRVLGLAPVVPADPAAPDPVAPRGLPPVVPEARGVPDPVRRAELTNPAGPVVRADLHLVDRAELDPVVPARVGPDLVAREAPADTDPLVPAELDLVVPVDPVVPLDLMVAPPVVPVELDPADRVARLDLMVVPVDLDPVSLVDTDLTVRAVPVDLAAPAVRVDLAAREDRVAPDLMNPVDRVVPVDHRRRLMCSTAPSTAVARNSAVRETRRTASAHPITVLLHRPGSTASVGTAGRLRGVLRRTGMGRLLPVAGTVRRLLVVGTRGGTVPAAT
jgi:hypothetical protein